MSADEAADAERERLLARWASEPRFHALMKTLETAASRGGKLEVLESLRMAEQILPVGSHVVAGEDVALIREGLGGISSGDAGSYPGQTKAAAAALAARLGRSAS